MLEQTVGNYVGTNCVSILADLFVYSYEADFIQRLVRKNEKKFARSFNFTFHYIDDVFSLNNCRFCDFVYRIYPIELEIKDSIDTAMFASYLDIYLAIDSEDKVRTERNSTTKEIISSFPLRICHLYVAPFQQPVHMEYIYISIDPILQVWFISRFP